MFAKRVLYYGKDEPLPEQIGLHAGPLQLVFEDGDLRYIKYGGKEILRRIYVAIRDRNWGTILPVYSNLQMDVREDSFSISFDVENKRDEIDFAWKGLITGNPDGTIAYTLDGEARSTFMKNRIGFCILHPADLAGSPAEVKRVDGSATQGEFPVLIVPKQPVLPFAEMRAMSHQVEPGLWADVSFEGDIFEMEDQRNWTDASYKTFCTPLRIPYPAEIQAGTPVRQSIRLSLRETPQAGSMEQEGGSTAAPAGLSIRLLPAKAPLPLPPIGLGVAAHGQPLTERETRRLNALHLDHLRVDLTLGQPDAVEALRRAAAEVRSLGARLDVALLVPDDADEMMKDFAARVKEINPPLRTWLVYPVKEKFLGGSSNREVVELARKYLDGLVPGAKFAAGSNTDLIFMMRSLPPFERIDAATFAIIPQVHAFDNTSIVETLVAQGQAVATARHTAGLPVMVSPVTFKMRHNPYATGPAPELKPGELPPQVDIRQMSLFGAGWTLGSIASLAQSGAASLTYFETTGWRGVMETEAGAPLPEVFRSYPGGVYPLFFVFAAVGEFTGGEVVPVLSSDQMAANALLLRKNGRQRLLVANHTPTVQRVNLPAEFKPVSIHHLDETNVEEAICNPEKFLAAAGEPGSTPVELLPYGLAWIDFQ